MLAFTDHIKLQVSCPACPESHTVSLSVVEECQRILDEVGPCSGMASYECPASYYATLVAPEAISQLRVAIAAFERAAHLGGVEPVLERTQSDNERTNDTSRVRDAVRSIVDAQKAESARADAAAHARALARWENEGGAPEPESEADT